MTSALPVKLTYTLADARYLHWTEQQLRSGQKAWGGPRTWRQWHNKCPVPARNRTPVVQPAASCISTSATNAITSSDSPANIKWKERSIPRSVWSWVASTCYYARRRVFLHSQNVVTFELAPVQITYINGSKISMKLYAEESFLSRTAFCI